MNTNAKEQIEYIDQSLEWIRKHRPSDFESKFLSLVEKRRELRKMLEAERDNPAIAAYGISQVGKSYLMNNMLQQTVIEGGKKKIKPFEVETKNGKVPFIDDINPVSNTSEATGVITRFSSFSQEEGRYSLDYPVLMKCLSIADITLVLCDGYYNDTSDCHTEKYDEIDAKADEIYKRYINRQPLPHSPVTADDILDMKAYFKASLNNAQAFNDSKSFFNKLAAVIDRIPVDDYPEIFTYLWHNSENPANDQYLNNLYVRLLNVYRKLDYKKDVYLPIDAVLNKDDKRVIDNERTIMSVDCLNGLGNPDYSFSCNAFVKNADGSFKSVGQINKSELAAVCAEVVFKINEAFLENKASYSTRNTITDKDSTTGEYITTEKDTITDPRVKALLDGKGEIKYDFLKTTDLLDFPGARSRKCAEGATLKSPKLLTELLLRGKVAYLFNKYSDAKVINILLYCHHRDQAEVPFIPLLLKDWIDKYIGKTASERAQTLSDTASISPFFYIATKFNMDMEKQPKVSRNTLDAIKGRWYERFIKVLRKYLFSSDGVEWVNNYTSNGDLFQNSYLLRDYTYSGKMYTGFADKGCESGYFVDPSNELSFDKDYRDNLREAFVNSEDVKLLFKDPALSWDVATTMNNDGALFIIENLAKIASVIGNARNRQFERQCKEIASSVLKEINNYYTPEDDNKLIQQKKDTCREIRRDLLAVCQLEPEYFGLLLQVLQFRQEDCERYIREYVLPNWAALVKEKSRYALLRHDYHFEENDTIDSKWEKIKEIEHFADRGAAKTWFNEKGINFDELLSSSVVNISNSLIISDCVFNYWIEQLKETANLNVNGYEMESGNFSNIKECLKQTAVSLNLSKTIGKNISEVDGMGDNIDGTKMRRISDMAVTIINNFVIDFGYEYLTDMVKHNVHDIYKDDAKETELIAAIEADRKEKYSNKEMTDFLCNVLDDGQPFQAPYLELFDRWRGCMLVATMVSVGVKDYDRAENAEIEPIIKGLENSIA